MDDIINHHGQLKRGKTRRDGWTDARRKIFLDVLAATGSVGHAERSAGMSKGCARGLRRRDARFGELWEEALALAYRRLEEELLAVALGQARRPGDPGDGRDDEREEPAPEHLPRFDAALAIQILKMRRRHQPIGPRKPVRPLEPAEVEIALMKKLADLAIRLKGA